jgi:hypothetical protein
MSKVPDWFSKKLKDIDKRLFLIRSGRYWVLYMETKGFNLPPNEVEHLGEMDNRQMFKLNPTSIYQRTFALKDGTPIPAGSLMLEMIRESLWNYRQHRSYERSMAEQRDLAEKERKHNQLLDDAVSQEANSIKWAKAPKVGVT